MGQGGALAGAELTAALEALLAEAEYGGAGAAIAAERAALMAEGRDHAMALRALGVASRLNPLDSRPRLTLSRLHAEAGDLDAARREAAAVFSAAVDETARARAAFILGEIARARDETAEARDAYAAALRIEDAILASDPTDPSAARWRARAAGRLAELDAAGGDRAGARLGAQGALTMLRAVASQMGEAPALAADIADAELRLAAFDLDDHDAETAERRVHEAIGRYEALAVAEPHEPHWRAALADAWTVAAEAAFARGLSDAARDCVQKALTLRLKLAGADPAERWALAGVWRMRAGLLAALGETQGAVESLAQARALGERICAEARDAEEPARFLVQTLLEQADAAFAAGDLVLARDAANQARRRAEFFAVRDNGEPWRVQLAAAWDRFARVARAVGALPQAQDACARAVELRRMLCEADPLDRRARRALAAALLRAGDADLAAQAAKSARAAFSECVEIRLDLAEITPGDADFARDLAVALERLGLAASDDGDAAAARAAWEQELTLAEHVFPDMASVEAQRFRAIIETHLASLGGVDAGVLRAAALAGLESIARRGAFTERDTRLREQLRAQR